VGKANIFISDYTLQKGFNEVTGVGNQVFKVFVNHVHCKHGMFSNIGVFVFL
jgi:hypothetical protein